MEFFGAGGGLGYILADAGALAAEAAPGPGVVGAAAVTSAGVGIYSALNAPKAPVTQTQTDYTKQQEAAATAQAEALLKRRGMASTILTSPRGPTGANTGKTTLGA
jgi:hypothetical protein